MTLTPALDRTLAATAPQGTWAWHSATFTPGFARSATEAMFAGLFGGVTISIVFFANVVGLVADPASTTVAMFVGLAEANTSAGAAWVSWVASVELAPKLNFTVVPGCAASNCFPISVNDSVNDAAANTVTVPVTGAVVAGDADGTVDAALDPVVFDPHPTRTAVARAHSAQNFDRVLTRPPQHENVRRCRRPRRGMAQRRC